VLDPGACRGDNNYLNCFFNSLYRATRLDFFSKNCLNALADPKWRHSQNEGDCTMTTDDTDDVAAAALYFDLIKRRSFSPFKSFDEWAAAWIANDNLQVAEGLLHCVLSLPNRNDIRPVKFVMRIISDGAIGDEKFTLQLREKALAVLVDGFLKEDDVYQGAPRGWGLIRNDPNILIDVITHLRDLDDDLRPVDSRLKTVKWFLTCCYGTLRAFDRTALRRKLEEYRALLFMTLLCYDMDNLIRGTLDQDIRDAKRWFAEIEQDMEALRSIACRYGKPIDEVLLYDDRDDLYRDSRKAAFLRDSRKAAFLYVSFEHVYRARQIAFSAP
jgi:hypothetical protein